MTTEFIPFKTTPLFDPDWEPKFKSTDLVSLHGIKGIDSRDLWVVYGRLVDEHKVEWYFVRPGTTNRNKYKIGKLRVQKDCMRKESKYT